MRGVGDGREGDRLVSGTMSDGSQGLAAADDSVADAPGSGNGGMPLLLLAQGWTGSAIATTLERDPHTIGRWAAACCASLSAAGGGVESSGAGTAPRGRHRHGQLELEGGPSVCRETLRHRPEPQQYPCWMSS